jgi:hypothetical protein
MAEVINLKRVRKAKARSEQQKTAAENRRRFGRTKAEKAADRGAADRAGRSFDGKQLDKKDG